MTLEHLSCQELVEVVTDYLEGRLAEEDSARVDAHLALCPPCVQYIEQIRVLLRLGGEERDREVPALVQHLLPAFRSYRRGLT
jgi:predicted anti-sigma-YlaC factor YlaD